MIVSRAPHLRTGMNGPALRRHSSAITDEELCKLKVSAEHHRREYSIAGIDMYAEALSVGEYTFHLVEVCMTICCKLIYFVAGQRNLPADMPISHFDF